MRVLSSSKRQEILALASQVFAEVGYERATMAEISTRVGGSKATLYRYFPSKKELFLEVADSAAKKHFGERHLENALSREDVAQKLQHVGELLLTFLMLPETIAMERMVIAEAGQSDIGLHYFTNGPKNGLESFKLFFADAIAKGWIRQEDPQAIAAHALGLLGSEISQQRLFGVQVEDASSDLPCIVARAVDVFMRAYAT
jgi:AcrR family transcriptional regulator